jgi:hypothetical protein
MPIILTKTAVPKSRSELEKDSRAYIFFVEATGPDFVAAGTGYLEKLINETVKLDNLDLSTLRYICIASSLADETKRWLRDLGRPPIVTEGNIGDAVGKTITWHVDHTGQTISILIFPVEIIQGLCFGMNLPRTVVAHELAHVHDDAYCNTIVGPTLHPDARDLPEVVSFICRMPWGEYFAQRIASRHMTPDDRKNSVVDSSSMVAEFADECDQLKQAYRVHGDHLQIWQEATMSVGRIASVLGRAIGELHSSESSGDLRRQLVENLRPEWRQVTEKFILDLDSLFATRNSWNQNSLQVLAPLVLKLYQILGIFPQLQVGGLYVDIP